MSQRDSFAIGVVVHRFQVLHRPPILKEIKQRNIMLTFISTYAETFKISFDSRTNF